MALKIHFNKEAFNRVMSEAIEQQRENIIEYLTVLGTKCLSNVKEEQGYTDQTGNLSNSKSFFIFENGAMIREQFSEKIEGKTPTEIDARAVSRGIAEQVGRDYLQGFVLVVVAGMEYAVFVESNGRNVLQSAELLAMEEVKNLKLANGE